MSLHSYLLGSVTEGQNNNSEISNQKNLKSQTLRYVYFDISKLIPKEQQPNTNQVDYHERQLVCSPSYNTMECGGTNFS
jgi:hypothetical protein